MNIAPAPTPRTPASHPGNPTSANYPPRDGNGLAAATPVHPGAEPELAVVAVLGYN